MTETLDRMKSNWIYIFLLVWVMAAGCSPSKHCADPDLNLPENFGFDNTDSLTMADLEWWKMYSDTTLQNLISQALEYNKDMLIASERIIELEKMHRISKSALFPSLDLKVGGDHEFTNYHTDKYNSDPELDAKLGLSWEIDLWGNLRWASKKGYAEYLASVEAKRAMQMTIISSVATSYFELIALDNELKIVNRTLKTRKEGVRQAKLRFEGGLTSETSYQQAEVELASTASLIPDLQRKIALKESELALLVGRYPYRMNRSEISVGPLMDRDKLPVGVPTTLLQRRPDLRKAEQELKAAEAAVGVAQAERFPRLTINLAAGFEDDQFSTFIMSPFYYAAANIAAPIFSFGKRKAKFEASIAAYNQAKLSYEKKVLEVFKEVYDAVVTYRSACDNSVLKQNLQDAAQKYVELARFQYLNGYINYLDVLDAQRKYFDAQISLSNAITNEYLALVKLYKALGGGWDMEMQSSSR